MKFGIANIPLAPIRITPSDKAEMTNQILFGEYFRILKTEENWSKIELAHDKYIGWICKKQYKNINQETYLGLTKEKSTFSTSIFDTILKETLSQPITIGSMLPSYKNGHVYIEEEMYSFQGPTTTGFNKINKLIDTAMGYLNTPYLWGGRSPLGIDCSGLIQMTYRLQGILLPRDAYQQIEIGKIIKSIKESKAGDLAFFNNDKGEIIHVGIIITKDKIIHASGKVRIDNIDQKGIFNKSLAIYTHKLNNIKRII